MPAWQYPDPQGNVGANSANNSADTSLVTANADGSLLERVEYLQVRNQLGWRLASKAIAAAGTSFTTGASPVTLFTVTGDVMVRVFATIQTALASTSNNGTLAIGVTGNTGGLLAATTMDGTNFPTGSVWAGDTSATLKSEAFSGAALNGAPIAGGADIIATIATNSATAGVMVFYCLWTPLSSDGDVTAA